jgi:16S rRNA C967 or C1407 C5-methylase (RsmB/RsmF family)/NOL1/NOP2/fmu family ribosome biogenesis protein
MRPLPEKFEENLRRMLGDEFPAFATSLQEPAPVSLRTHPLKNNPFDDLPRGPWSELGRYLPGRPVFTLDPLFHGGSFYVQEASSMFLEQAFKQSINLNQPLNILDLCAAPGGKSTHILSLVNAESLLVSNEVMRPRAAILSENIQKWGYPNTIVTNNDPADFQKLKGFFDVMVIDAPCSGEGLFRKDPEAMSEWSPDNVQLCCSRQKRIVSDAWDALKQNGILIYCTCTYNETENEENLKWLAKDHSVEFLKLSIDPSWGVEEVTVDGLTAYRFFPHRTSGEGFFLSVIRKTAQADTARLKTKSGVARPLKKIQERLDEWVTDPRGFAFFQFNDLLFFVPSGKSEAIEFLLQQLKIVYAGTNIASLKHDKLVPDHALALSVHINRAHFPEVELNESQALEYLRREAIRLSGERVGFTLVTYQKLPIGWVNVLPNRVNNMYPQEWRIRMSGKAG